MKRRLIASLLALCMALTLLPAQTLADETEDTPAPALEESASESLTETTPPETEAVPAAEDGASESLTETTPVETEAVPAAEDGASESLTETTPPETEAVPAASPPIGEETPLYTLSPGVPSSFRLDTLQMVYFEFTSEPDKTYRLTLNATGNDGNPIRRPGNLYWWSEAVQNWLIDDTGSSSNYLLSPEESGPCYLQLNPFWLKGTTFADYTVTLSEYAPDTISVQSGQAVVENSFLKNSFSIVIPITVQIPAGCDPNTIHAGVKYQLGDRVYTTNIRSTSTGYLWSPECYISPSEYFPGCTYQYEAFVDVYNGDSWGSPIWEGQTHDFTAPEAEFTPISAGASKTIKELSAAFLSFTPTESGSYIFSMSENIPVYFWDEDILYRESLTNGEKSKILKLTAGTTLYILAENYNEANVSVTVDKFTPTVSTFTVAVDELRENDIEYFASLFHITASVPIDSSFRIGTVLNGEDSSCNYLDWESESFEMWLRMGVFPNTDYTLSVYIEELDPKTNSPVTGSRVYGNTIEFTTPEFDAPLLQTGTLDVIRGKPYFRFMSEEAGIYQISVSGNSGSLLYWDAAKNRWDGPGFFSGSTTLLLSVEAGVQYYLQLFSDDSDTAVFQVEVTPFTSTVTDFSVKVVDAKPVIPGFTASVAVEVELPFDSYCRVGLEVLEDENWLDDSSAWVMGFKGEKQTTALLLSSLPNNTYTYRAYLIPIDSSGMALDGAKPVYSQEMKITSTSYSPDTTTILEIDKKVTGTFDRTGLYFAFTPPEDGFYNIDVTGTNYLLYSNSANSGWRRPQSDEFATLYMEQGVQRYFYFSEGLDQSHYSIVVSKFVPTVTGFSVTSSNSAPDGTDICIIVNVTAPLGSTYTVGVDYWQEGEDQLFGSSNVEIFSTEETTSGLFQVSAYPEKTYVYQAFVRDRKTGETYYEDTEHTFYIPISELKTEELTEGVWTAPASGKTFYSFTPAKSGNHLFSVDGYYDTLTVLREDGSWDRFFSKDDMEFNLRLQANQLVYVILNPGHGSGPCSVMVRSAALTAVMNSSGQVTVSMDAESAGQYVFAAYNQSDKLLAASIVNKTADAAEVLTATLSSCKDASYVKAFQLGGNYKPLSPAETVSIVYR